MHVCVYVCFRLCVHVIKNTMSQQGMVCSAVTEIALCSSPSLIQSTNPLATGAAKLDFLELLQQCYLYRPHYFSIQVKIYVMQFREGGLTVGRYLTSNTQCTMNLCTKATIECYHINH